MNGAEPSSLTKGDWIEWERFALHLDIHGVGLLFLILDTCLFILLFVRMCV